MNNFLILECFVNWLLKLERLGTDYTVRSNTVQIVFNDAKTLIPLDCFYYEESIFNTTNCNSRIVTKTFDQKLLIIIEFEFE